jgi:cobalamin biosynthesis protein CbiD
VILAGFPGKLGKFALGHRDTHERRGILDLAALASLVPGSPAELWRKGFVAASSARWAMDLLSEEEKRALGHEIAKEVVNQGMTLTGSGTEIGGLVFSYEGERLGAFPFWLEEIIGG